MYGHYGAGDFEYFSITQTGTRITLNCQHPSGINKFTTDYYCVKTHIFPPDWRAGNKY